MRARLALLAVLASFCSSCGYHVSGHADTMPKSIHTIALPAWGNITARYKLSEWLPRAIGREFLSRTRYRITAEPNEADAILTGSIVNYLAFPSVSDPQTGRATAIQISVYMQITLTERATGKVIYTRPNIEFKTRYEIAVDQPTYFDESDIALDRLSREVARSVVSSVLEAF
jgi:hypothetical protein